MAPCTAFGIRLTPFTTPLMTPPQAGVIFSAHNALDDALVFRRDITEPTMRAGRLAVTTCHKPGPTSAEAAERDRPARICPDVWFL